MDKDLPERIGPYEIEELLGEGGMGVVYRGVSRSGEQVAIKQIRGLGLTDEDRARFEIEIAAIKSVVGPRTARYCGEDTKAERPWLAMAYVPGRTLRQWVGDNGPLPPPMVAIMGAALAEGLEGVHGAGLLHRDLKPHNIILAHSGPVVIDFGLALLTNAKVAQLEGTGRITPPGRIVGTLVCMPPEQVLGRKLTEAADVYALGATLLYAATAHYPYPGAKSDYDLMKRIESVSESPDLSDLDPSLLAPISAMLAHEPQDRPTLDEVTDQLMDIVTKAGLTAVEARERLRKLTAADVPLPPEPGEPSVVTTPPKPRRVSDTSHTASPPGAIRAANRLRRAYARSATL